MSRLSVISVCLLMCVLVFVPQVYAASPFDSFWSWLVGGISQSHVDSDLEKINNAALPYGIRISPATGPSETANQTQNETVTPTGNVQGITTQNSDPAYNAARQYQVAAGIRLPKTESSPQSGILDIFFSIFADIQKLLGFGNDQAQKFEFSNLPQQATGQLTGRNTYGANSLAQNPNTLGAASDNSQAMLDALPMTRCSELPYGNNLCDSLIAQAQITPFDSPTPTGVQTGSEPTVTPGDNGQPADIQTDCHASGYCTRQCMIHFWPDPKNADIAAYICNRESGGNPFALNSGCLSGTSVDYSIGLFQINLLAHCAAAGPHYTWHPPSCTFDNETARAQCEADLKDPFQNIAKAVSLSGGGSDWCPWSTAKDLFCHR